MLMKVLPMIHSRTPAIIWSMPPMKMKTALRWSVVGGRCAGLITHVSASPLPPAPLHPSKVHARGVEESKKPTRASGVGLPKVLRASPFTGLCGLRKSFSNTSGLRERLLVLLRSRFSPLGGL